MSTLILIVMHTFKSYQKMYAQVYVCVIYVELITFVLMKKLSVEVFSCVKKMYSCISDDVKSLLLHIIKSCLKQDCF